MEPRAPALSLQIGQATGGGVGGGGLGLRADVAKAAQKQLAGFIGDTVALEHQPEPADAFGGMKKEHFYFLGQLFTNTYRCY